MILVTIMQIFYHLIMIIVLINVISTLHLNVGFQSCVKLNKILERVILIILHLQPF